MKLRTWSRIAKSTCKWGPIGRVRHQQSSCAKIGDVCFIFQVQKDIIAGNVSMNDRRRARMCWWEKPLVVALKHSEGIKHTVLFQETNSLQTQKLNNTRPLSFSLVFLSTLSTHNNISLACYLYTNSKQDNSTFKCEGGWRLWRQTTGGWRMAAGRLVAGRWQLVAAFLDLLDGLSLIQQISPLNSIEGCHAKHELHFDKCFPLQWLCIFCTFSFAFFFVL